MPSRGSGDATAVASTAVSPDVTRAAPDACLAMRPVSNCSRLPPASSTETSCFMFFSSLLRHKRRVPRLGGRWGAGKGAGITDSTRCIEPRLGIRLGRTGPRLQSSCSLGSRRSRAEDLACELFPNAQLGDHGPVTFRIVGLQVVQQATALAHQHQKPRREA